MPNLVNIKNLKRYLRLRRLDIGQCLIIGKISGFMRTGTRDRSAYGLEPSIADRNEWDRAKTSIDVNRLVGLESKHLGGKYTMVNLPDVVERGQQLESCKTDTTLVTPYQPAIDTYVT